MSACVDSTFTEPPPPKKQKFSAVNGSGVQNGVSDESLGPMPEGEKTLQLRKEHIGSSQTLHYRDYPLHIVRGEGQYFFDEHGQKYLDTTNNVACVGHSHPKVVEACSAQMATLCTNSRFLNERMCVYAKKLCSTLPAKLSQCFFTNSGSEANDLALQLAKVFTGKSHVISLEGCYHGHLSSLKPLSHYKYAHGVGMSKDITIATLPDVYRGKYRDEETAGPLYAQEIKEIVEEQKKKGEDVGVFIHESLLSCAGQIIPPKGYLRDVYKCVHDAGGVVIADEVQTGFARMGDYFWAFEVSEVCPDIITCGKPMGNGHPVAAVITTKEIAAKFASSGVEYFNTFGGNPVSMAIAEAVLTVIEEEGLQRNAKELGAYLMEGLKAMQERYECMGDVRGVGLFIGIDFVKDRESRTADVELARAVKYKILQEHKIIVHMDGIDPNILKIKPPLVINKQDCEHFLRALDTTLTSIQQHA